MSSVGTEERTPTITTSKAVEAPVAVGTRVLGVPSKNPPVVVRT
jgi:hypothetical protein